VGFGREARRVRDPSLPHRFRLHALGSCIQIAQPIGFNATWSYLESETGLSPRDSGFVLPALDLLEGERTRHRRVERDYAVLRREEKRNGLRFPPRDHVTPRTPPRWHGDERTGAVHALTVWRRRTDRVLEDHPECAWLVGAVDRALAGAPVGSSDAAGLQSTLTWARRQIHVVGWDPAPVEYRIASVANFLLGQLHLVTFGGLPVGSRWQFVEPRNS
jgi:hypothetical protein